MAAQQSRVQNIHDRPQIADVVFNGCARHANAVLGLERSGGLRALRTGIFDVLGLVEHDRVPRERLKKRSVLTEQGIVGHHHRVVGHLVCQGFLLRRPIAAVVHEHRKIGRKAVGLLLPVAYHRGGADHEARLAGRLGVFVFRGAVRRALPLCGAVVGALKEGEGLHRLAQPHVVSEACPKSPPFQKRKPGVAALLVGPQRALEAVRRRKRLDRVAPVEPIEQIAQFPACGDVLHRKPAGPLLRPERHVHHVPRRHVALVLPVETVGHLPDGVEVHLHPLPAQVDQRRLYLRQLVKLLPGEHVIPEGHLPVELDDRVEREPAPCLHGRGRCRGRRGQALLRASPFPPRRHLHPEARLPQERRILPQKDMGLGRLQLQARRIGRFEALLDGRPHAHRLAEGREQVRFGLKIRALEDAPGRLVGLPRVCNVNLQARVARRLQEIADVPQAGGPPHSLFLDFLRLFETEREAERRIGRDCDPAPPCPKLTGQVR